MPSLTIGFYEELTAPGGINYTENRIITPQIVPSIKGHAKFAEKEDIGWFRSDDKTTKGNRVFTEEDLLSGEYPPDMFEVGEVINSDDLPSKTRRILELQSDLFQKGRKEKSLTGNYKTKNYID